MTVSLDTSAQFNRTDTSNPYAPGDVTISASARAVVAFVANITVGGGSCTGISIGGTALRKIGVFQDNAGEPCHVQVWALFDGEGDTVPTGTAAVSVSFQTATTDDFDIIVTSWLGSASVKLVDFGGCGSDMVNPRYTLQTLGMTCMAVAFNWTGTAAPISPASSTRLQSHDIGQAAWSVDRQTTASSSAFDVNITAASDDAVIACLNMTDDTWNVPTTGFYRKIAVGNQPAGTSMSGSLILCARSASIGDHCLIVAVVNGSRTTSNFGVNTSTKATPDVEIATSTNHTIALCMVELTASVAYGDSVDTSVSTSADYSIEVYQYKGCLL